MVQEQLQIDELKDLMRLANIKLDSIGSLLNTVLNKYKIVDNLDDEHDEPEVRR